MNDQIGLFEIACIYVRVFIEYVYGVFKTKPFFMLIYGQPDIMLICVCTYFSIYANIA